MTPSNATPSNILRQLTSNQPHPKQLGGAAATIRTIMQVANQLGTLTVNAVSWPMQQEIKKLEHWLWMKVVYEHLVWLENSHESKSIDEALHDAQQRVFALQAQAPKIRQAFVTIFSTAGLEAAQEYRKALARQIPRDFRWVAVKSG